MSKQKVVKLIRKSNQLVEAKYKFDIWETRIFTKMLSMIRKDDVDFKDYRIYISEIITDYGLQKQQSAYERLKDGALSLMNRTVRILRDTDEGQKEFYTNIIAGFEHLTEEGLYIDISFHPKMKPFLLQLKSRFTTYDARNILRLPSSYSIRIYELLKQYEKIKKRTIELQELKELVGVVEEIKEKRKIIKKDRYPLYGNFRQKVLLKAQKDLKAHTDISFTFDPIKKGRKVTAITFYISKNVPIRVEPKGNEDNDDPKTQDIFNMIYPIMEEWEDINEASVRKLITRYGSERILAACSQTREDVEKGGIIRGSRGKYFYGLAHNAPTLFDQRQEVTAKQNKKKEQQQARQNKKKELEGMLENLKKRRSEVYSSILDLIKQENPELFETVLEEMRESSAYNRTLSKAENLGRPMLRALIGGRIRNMLPERFTEVDKMDKEIKYLERQIR